MYKNSGTVWAALHNSLNSIDAYFNIFYFLMAAPHVYYLPDIVFSVSPILTIVCIKLIKKKSKIAV